MPLNSLTAMYQSKKSEEKPDPIIKGVPFRLDTGEENREGQKVKWKG